MNHFFARALTHPRVLPLVFRLTGAGASILMFHRFADPGSHWDGDDPAVLRNRLAWLRRHRFSVLPLREILERLETGQSLYKTIGLTVDDGYADFAECGMPVFAEFDCPVTVFLVSGFLDGRCWLWWDMINYLVTATDHQDVRLEQDGNVWSYRWKNGPERRATILELIDRLKALSMEDNGRLITRLATELEVPLPARPTREFAPLRWEDVRRCGRMGATFGPHTVIHPILTATNDERAATEITESWQRVQAEAGEAAIPVFCYPNGDPQSFGPREQSFVRAAGLEAAVTTVAGYLKGNLYARGGRDVRYAIPRMPYIETGETFVYIASGLDRAKRALRG